MSRGLQLKRKADLGNCVKTEGILCMLRGQAENFKLEVLGW